MRYAVFSILIFSFAGCGRGLEQEPNDHFTQATLIGSKTRMEGTLRSAQDIDVYRLDVSRTGQTLSLHLGGIRSVDFVISFQDADRRELKRFDQTSQGGDEHALNLGLAKNVYYIVVSNKNPAADNTEQRYALTLTYADGLSSEQEPNDRALEANLLRPGSVLQGHYFPAQNLLAEESDLQEEDWFKINLHNDEVFLLNIDVSEVPGVDSVLEVYGPNAYKIKEIDAGGPGEPEVLKGFGLRGPVHYFLRLRSKSRYAANAEIPYQILTEVVPYRGVQEFESNDQRLEATPMNRDTLSGTIAPVGDVDWYKIEIGNDGKNLLTANVEASDRMDLTLTLTDELGRPLLKIDDQGRERPESLTGYGVTRGVYYLVVAEKTGKAANARRGYTLTRTLQAYENGLEYEINNSSSAAQPLDVGTSVDGYIAPTGDVDWYVFNVYQASHVSIEATGLLNVELVLDLYGQEGVLISTAASAGAGGSVSLEAALEPGTYWAQLSPAENSGSNIRDKYTLRVLAQ